MDEDLFQKVKYHLIDKGVSLDFAEELFTRSIEPWGYSFRLTPEDLGIIIQLFSRELYDPGSVQIFISQVKGLRDETAVFSEPAYITFAVLGPDWAGLLDTCTGIIHEEDLNIYYCQGFVLRFRDTNYGIVFIEVEIPSEDVLKRFLTMKTDLEARITRAAKVDRSLQLLQKGETRKIEHYTRVIEILRGLIQPEDREALIGDNGEAVHFFVARTDAYIHERDAEDIAYQILTNYRFQKKVRESSDDIPVKIRNVETTGGALTGISVAVRQEEFSMGDCMRIIEEVVPNYIRKYDKAFITPDGITVMRIEVTQANGEPLSHDQQMQLYERIRGYREESRRCEFYPGIELIGRKIVPAMREEEKNLHLPQVYMHPQSRNLIKIIMVTSGEDRGKTIHVVRELNRIKGVVASCPDNPSHCNYNIEKNVTVTQEISIIDTWIDFPKFFKRRKGPFDEEQVYTVLANQLKSVSAIGQRFRIFDATTRMLRQMRYERILNKLLPSTLEDPLLVKNLFYRMGDKYILETASTDEEFVDQIETGVQAMKAYNETGEKRNVVLTRDISRMRKGSRQYIFTALLVVSHASPEFLDVCIRNLANYEILSFTQVDSDDTRLFLFRINDRRTPGPLSTEKMESLKENILTALDSSNR
jgi:hypothetical protein